MGSSGSEEKGDLILAALKEAFMQKQRLRQNSSKDGGQMELDANSDQH